LYIFFILVRNLGGKGVTEQGGGLNEQRNTESMLEGRTIIHGKEAGIRDLIVDPTIYQAFSIALQVCIEDVLTS
jgi:hypothetical protein